LLHLLHPALLHFSVAFVIVGGICEITGLLFKREAWDRFGGTLLLIGLASLVPTMISGYLAANTVMVAPAGQALLDVHEWNAWILLGLLLGAQFWKAWCRGQFGPAQQKIYALWIVAVVVFTFRAAWLGGQMVYLQGVGVR
jgi:uncharacterized membrane protein